MKKSILYMSGVILIIISFFYCIPNTAEEYRIFIVSMLNGLFFNYALYFGLKYLKKKNHLSKLIKSTNNYVRYFPNFVMACYCIMAVCYIMTMIWIRNFSFAGNILPALFSIDAASRSNRLIREETSK